MTAVEEYLWILPDESSEPIVIDDEALAMRVGAL